MRHFISTCSIWAMLCSPALGEEPAAAQPSQAGLERIAESVYRVFTQPVHPTLEPVAPGGGLTLGIGASPEPFRRERGMLGLEGRASVSLKKYWIAEGHTWWQSSSRYRLETYGRARSMRELDYYGVGIDTPRGLRSNFHLNDRSAGGLGWIRPVPWLGVGGRLEGLWPDVDRGHHDDVPSIETVFTELTAPGLAAQPAFLRGQVFVDVNYPSNAFERARTGGDYQIGYNVYDDVSDGSAYSFRRFTVEMQQRIALGPRPGRLTLHLLLSTSQTDAGRDVPFYLMPTLGGAANLMAFNEQILGGDETVATLRGFADYRFRDRNLLLIQSEYRFMVRGPVQGTVFAEAGQVARAAGGFSASRMKGDAGLSLSLMRSTSTVIRIDVAFGSGEGARGFVTLGRVLAP